MLKKNLEQREKSELISIIQHMLHQEPELQWLLMTLLPTASSRKSSVAPSAGTLGYGNRGCEHAAALLLVWHELPETFTHMDDIDTLLERQSKAQLITLIKQLLEKQPEVEWQLTMPPLPSHNSVPIDTEEYRRQVDAAFRHGGREWDAVYGISSDLYEITATAARFAHQRDYANAAAIYEVVAMETLSHYLSYRDEDGALGCIVSAPYGPVDTIVHGFDS